MIAHISSSRNDPFKVAQQDLLANDGSRDGSVVRALVSHRYGLGSIPARCHMWDEFVVGSRFAPRVSLRVLWFSSLHKGPA